MPGYPSARTCPRGWQMNLLNSTKEVLLKHTLQSTSRYQTPMNRCIQFCSMDSAPSDWETDELNSTARTREWKWKERKGEEVVVHRGHEASTEDPSKALVHCSFQPLQTSISRLLGGTCLFGGRIFFQGPWLVCFICCGFVLVLLGFFWLVGFGFFDRLLWRLRCASWKFAVLGLQIYLSYPVSFHPSVPTHMYCSSFVRCSFFCMKR